MKKANDEVTHIMSSLFINMICRLLALFSTNIRDKNMWCNFKEP